MPFTRFSTTHDVEGVLQACPRPSVTEYVVIGEPPSEDGADHDTVTWPSPATTEVIVGAPGTVTGATGVAESETAEDPPVPTALVAVTAKEYDVPLLRPVTEHDVDAAAHVIPSGSEVTV